MVRRRVHKPYLVHLSQEVADASYIRLHTLNPSFVIPIRTKKPLVGYEKSLERILLSRRLPLSNRIPVVSEEALTANDYRTRRNIYTITGSYWSGPIRKVNKPTDSTVLKDTPPVSKIKTIKGLALHKEYRVFINPHSGDIHAIVSPKSKSLIFYRRYYSLYVKEYIKEISAGEALLLNTTEKRMAIYKGQPIKWATWEELVAWIYKPEGHPPVVDENDWGVVDKKLTIIDTDNGIPINLCPHTIVHMNFLYGRWK